MKRRRPPHQAEPPPRKSRRLNALDTLLGAVYSTPLMAQPNMSSRARSLLWWGLAALALLLGYADLARGGVTLAPILLVLGYCVLVPIAILK